MEKETKKTVAIGIFVLASALTILGILMFLRPSFGDGGTILRVRFSSIDKVTVGTRVTFAGKPVGEVILIKEVFEARQQSSEHLGRAYFFELHLLVDSSVKVYDTDDIIIQTSGLFGEKSIAIIPKIHKSNETPQLLNGEIIYSTAASSLEETVKQMISFASTVEKSLRHFLEFLGSNNQEFRNSLSSFRSSLDQFNITLKEINKSQLIPTVQGAALSFSSTMQAIEGQIKSLEKEGLIKNLSDITSAFNQPNEIKTLIRSFSNASLDIEKSASSLQQSLAPISQAQGSLGKFIQQDDIYLRTVSLMNRLETLFNDINHYGLLFHLDKGWQRQRTKRRNILTNLQNAEQFRRYFDDELDLITASLSRVSMLMQESGKRSHLIENKEFQSSFSDLLRRVESLEATLKLYNQQLIQPQNGDKGNES